jgi:Domain of unknown function (DUF4383)
MSEHEEHLPVNHPLRPVYRVLAGLVGAYSLVFGIVGVAQTQGTAVFAQTDLPMALGLRTNPAFAYLSILAGAVLVVTTVIGRNLGYFVNIAGGLLYMVVGLLMLALLRTDANYLGFTMTTVIVSFILGTVVFAAGLYGRTGTEAAHRKA